jgi:multicomponent Na+:H+ antiporter subunit B
MSDAGEEPLERGPYVESTIIMTTVRVVAPFVLTFGLFVMFHGADTSGGGFQGGVIVGTVVLLLGIAFGIETTRDWVGPIPPMAAVGLGVLLFLAVGLGSVLVGGAFLEYNAFDLPHGSKYSIELVELGIGLIVSGIVAGLVFAITAAGEGEGP